MNITTEELKKKIQDFNGMLVSLVWKGYGSSIFLELGTLKKENNFKNLLGEASICLEWDWRIENNGKILFGSSNNGTEIARGIKSLVGSNIEKIEIVGEIPELTIDFSNGYRIQTMAMVSGDPHWKFRQKNATYLSWENRNGVERSEDEVPPGYTTEEKEYMHFIEKISDKLGRPIEDLSSGSCTDCLYYFLIDADFVLLDYGVCLNDKSKFYKQVVRNDSGCTVFSEEI